MDWTVAYRVLLLVVWRGRRSVRRVAVTGAVAAALLCLAGTASAQMLNFVDIQNWTGTGANQAAMVIDWHDNKGPESLVWGYRWDGAATGLQMLQPIDAADPRLQFTFAYGGGFIYSIATI